ncbi:MAG: hypothetical protein H6675_03865 [Dehalococcoidia bacterium]|nr:hypothetical protein [Dehalococcoidia bacterium]MCB9483127.1 hypothetical protein [Dehalococcoidia bacterium]
MTSAGGASLEQAILRRVLRSGDGRALHLRFRGEVLQKYREHPDAQLIRTATVGRVSIPGSWSLDIGIVEAPGEPVVLHTTLGDLLDRLPERERDHWVEHLVPEPASVNFLQMRMAAGACIDDGEPRPWE